MESCSARTVSLRERRRNASLRKPGGNGVDFRVFSSVFLLWAKAVRRKRRKRSSSLISKRGRGLFSRDTRVDRTLGGGENAPGASVKQRRTSKWSWKKMDRGA